jgi:hypothetical protein
LSEIHFVFSEMDGDKIMEYKGPDSRIISPGGLGDYIIKIKFTDVLYYVDCFQSPV